MDMSRTQYCEVAEERFAAEREVEYTRMVDVALRVYEADGLPDHADRHEADGADPLAGQQINGLRVIDAPTFDGLLLTDDLVMAAGVAITAGSTACDIGTSAAAFGTVNATTQMLVVGADTPQFRLTTVAGDTVDASRAMFGLCTGPNNFIASTNALDVVVRSASTGSVWLGSGTSRAAVFNATQARFEYGAVGTPGIAFYHDPDTGIYHIGANDVGLAAGGAQVFGYDAAEVRHYQPLNLYGAAQVTKYTWVGANGVSAAGARPATAALNGAGWFVYSFPDNLDRQVQADIMIPDDMDRTAACYLCVGWSTPSNGNDVVLDMYYLITAEDDDTEGAGVADLGNVFTASAVVDGLNRSAVVTIAGGTIGANDICIHLVMERDGNNVLDTLGDIMELHGLVLQYTADKLGE